MKTISVREMNARWAEVEAQVRNGETFQISRTLRGELFSLDFKAESEFARGLVWERHFEACGHSTQQRWR